LHKGHFDDIIENRPEINHAGGRAPARRTWLWVMVKQRMMASLRNILEVGCMELVTKLLCDMKEKD
jgi:hypothetical protein